MKHSSLRRTQTYGKRRESGSMNNIVLSLKGESQNHKRSMTVREKRGNEDPFNVVDFCLTITSLNVVSPDLRRLGCVQGIIVSVFLLLFGLKLNLLGIVTWHCIVSV